MPIYEYECESCEHVFEVMLGMNDRDKPLEDPCPECSEKSVRRSVGMFQAGADSTMTVDKMCPGFSKRMDHIKKGAMINESARKNIDRAQNFSPHGYLKPS
tara:strand:- start:667 stop:969 length:303 start_codon:yes stop_codon:yes gene_type:complete